MFLIPFWRPPQSGNGPSRTPPISNHFSGVSFRHLKRVMFWIVRIVGEKPVLPVMLVSFLVMIPRMVKRGFNRTTIIPISKIIRFSISHLLPIAVKLIYVRKPFTSEKLRPIMYNCPPQRNVARDTRQKHKPFVPDNVPEILNVLH